MATDGEDHYRIARHYTIRLAASPADDAAVRRILSEQRCGKDVDVAKYTASSAAMMLACRILVDGGEDDSSVEERLLSVPREQWLPYPVPVEVSAVGKPGPGGGYVLLDDLPKPVLEEYVVSIAGMRDLISEEIGGGKVCEVDRLYVDPEEDDSLPCLLVEMLAEHARCGIYATLRIAPAVELGQAEGFFKKASVASSGSTKAAAGRVQVDRGISGQAVEVWELDLNLWPGPAARSVPA